MLRGLFFPALIAGTACLALASTRSAELEALQTGQWNPEPTQVTPESVSQAVCGPPGCTWIRVESLLWWTSGAQTPPLISTGIVGDPGTSILFGNEPINDNVRPGIRVRAGRWLDCDQTCGWETSFFWLGNDADGFFSGSTTVVRPFIDANTGTPSVELVPGFADVNTGSNLLGVDLLRRCNLCCDCCGGWDPCDCSRTCSRRDFLIGFRYLNFSDRLTINEDLTPQGQIFIPGTNINLTDEFRSYNNFYGLKLGLAMERYRGPWSFEARPQVSVGLLDRLTKVRGQTVVTIPGVPTQQLAGGLYALSSNIGDYSSTRFAAVPELDLNVGYLIRPHLRLLAGYSLLFIPQVQRAGEQIDPVVNTQLLPPVVPPVTGPQRPAFPNHDSDLWVQGVNLGLEWRF